jgi:hypothetical protein
MVSSGIWGNQVGELRRAETSAESPADTTAASSVPLDEAALGVAVGAMSRGDAQQNINARWAKVLRELLVVRVGCAAGCSATRSARDPPLADREAMDYGLLCFQLATCMSDVTEKDEGDWRIYFIHQSRIFPTQRCNLPYQLREGHHPR